MNSKKNLKRNLLICLLAGSAIMYTLPLHAATSVIGNNTLPTGENSLTHNHTFDRGNLEMTITQSGSNGIIKWDSFDVGGSATVNFRGDAGGYNVLNYVNGANASQIYGTINANNNGNIFIVNPAGVQIGNSAQINVGRLYVSNNEMSDADFTHFMNNANPNDIINYALQGESTEAALMSLGNINATNVTFEGDGRIVIDTERIKKNDIVTDNFIVKTDDVNDVLLGYDAYNTGAIKNTYAEKDKTFNDNVLVNGQKPTEDVKGYMWVEDVKQLQAINTNLNGNYALRNSIDATATSSWNNNDGFKQIGTEINKAFTGKFDGLDYNIFGLTINRSGENDVGLFGVVNGATINNVTLVGGSITGNYRVGGIVGNAIGKNTVISNAINSASVTGNSQVGGIVGIITGNSDNKSKVNNVINTGTINGNAGNDVGGLIGSLNNSQLTGNSYNLGAVTSSGHDVGGLVGSASNSTIGNPSVVNDKPVENIETVYNRMDVTGAYNVGGIVGNMEGSTVQNAENSGTVTAIGYDDGNYTFHTDYTGNGYSTGGSKTVAVNVANAGGIAGTSSDDSTITDVLNTGDVSSSKQAGNDFYDAGNVGGIVGSAVDTNITNATNQENEIRGAHNVGGVAGYFSGAGRITGGINDGGDIMATGARYTNNGITAVVTETIRKDYDATNNDGKYVIGNIGGIVGYMEGDYVHIDASGNRGTVHTLDISDGNNISDASEAANVGGIVGKIDRSRKITDKNELGEKYVNAAVSNSYNTGDVRGFTAIGGIAGMMYNGGIAGAYNLGEIRSTRVATGNETPLNMGGIVGDTTEVSNARAFIYDVYNKGKIGDEAFKYKGRHVGGIVGRLSGVVEKAYNTGAIYNGAAVTGGIAGYLSAGKIENVFNTGNITVENNDGEDLGTQLGGLVGAANIGRGNVNISNAYNLGVIRSFNGDKTQHNVGGIVGYLVNYTSGIQGENAGNLTIKNVYTTGYLYSEGGETTVGVLYGGRRDNVTNPIIQNAVYITPSNNAFTEVADRNLQGATKVTGIYGSSEAATNVWNNFIQQSNVNNEGQTLDLWRVYDGTTPILNAFMPNSKDYFGNEGDYSAGSENSINTGIDKIQYGTAYNPLLTIINANKDLVYDWEELGINNDAGLAVYGYGVTLNNFRATGGTGYFGGTIYADGALNLKGSSDIGLGSASQIYGSDVTIGTNGKVTIYGDVTATGNKKDNNDTTGSISINAGEVDVYGALTSAKKDQQIQISGIAGSVNPDFNFENITDKTKPVTNVGDRFAHEVTASETGNITINAGQNATGNGNVNLYYGNKQEGLITTGGNLTVTGTGDVYVDSDLDIGGDLTLEGTGADSEVVLDITNIGQVQADNGTVTDALTGLHNFMHHFSDIEGDGKTITLNAEKSGDVKFTADMWDYDKNEFDLDKFDTSNHTFVNELNNIKANINGDDIKPRGIRDYTYIWISDAEQLNGIQKYYDNKAGSGILSYNFALKNDINASDLTDYNVIGTAANGDVIGYSGTFDGRGNRIIGLEVDNESNAGIFSQINQTGVVKDVNIYSGTFTGSDNAGAVAGVNNGRIEGIVTFGNTVTVTGNNGNAGGIVGINNAVNGKIVTNEDGTITLEPVDRNKPVTGIIDVESTGSVIAGNTNAIAGGLVGTNNGTLGNSYSNSAVTANAGTAAGLGGVVGVNTKKGNVQYVDSLGVTNGGAHLSNNVGGIIGINNGNMYSGFNESIVSGKDKVGGIIGNNTGTVTNIVNASSVDGFDTENASGTMAESNYVGGLVGSNSGSVTNGRNNGTITGTNYVGGMVGSNAQGATLTNLVNDSSAAITGEQYVGGIAGDNAGTITTGNEETDETVNLINRGTITGQKYVGGVAGRNSGTITNANNDVELNVKDKNQKAQFFGGIAGENTKGGIIKNATNTADVNADGATYVGGIVGKNDGTLENMAGNSGNVTGENYVGGVAGQNTNNKPLNGVEASNTGTVFATAGGAGGIFAVNNADITNSKLTNNGTVIGNSGNGTGGIFGVNTGNISTSSLINEVDGQVIGTNNVGGLIGKNTGTITGGRDDADSYYKYQIYNNGVINVGTYNNQNGDYEFTAGTGQNIGGLIGNNADSGSLTAGYNTGAINASGSTNVGGIAGSNAGTIDQVFNTVMTENGQNQTITGGTNVGGLVGDNTGTITNAYNTSNVVATNKDGIVGNIVGTNTGEVKFVYGVANNLIGSGTDAVNGYVIDGSDKWLQEGTYAGFKFGANGWKIYDGSTLPMLSVFLTKVTVVDQHLVDQYFSAKHYGEFHQITADDIKALIAIGAISAPDGFGAFNNNNGLIQGVADDAMANSGNWLYSGQIADSFVNGIFNPNNLGYDISLVYSPFELDNDPSSHWNYLFNDAPFDRNKDFRERKAEVNFVDGGMEI